VLGRRNDYAAKKGKDIPLPTEKADRLNMDERNITKIGSDKNITAAEHSSGEGKNALPLLTSGCNEIVCCCTKYTIFNRDWLKFVLHFNMLV
jgi:hypothetical protein